MKGKPNSFWKQVQVLNKNYCESNSKQGVDDFFGRIIYTNKPSPFSLNGKPVRFA
jgi:hypothetical protein